MMGLVGPPCSPAGTFVNLHSYHQSTMTETMYLLTPLSATCVILITLFNECRVCVFCVLDKFTVQLIIFHIFFCFLFPPLSAI